MSSAPSTSEAVCQPGDTPAQIDASCRTPLLVLFGSSAAWLAISAILGFIASLKFHKADLLADCPFFTYGHVQAAAFNTLLYGFLVQAAIGVMLWLIARLGRTALAQGGFAALGAIFWNVGVTLGAIGIMVGDGAGYEWFEFPKYAAPVLFLGYLLLGAVGGFTFAERKNEELYPSQWFLLAALFWFPWIYATALALIHWFPAVGVMQAVVHQWYAHNLVIVWLGSIGIAAALYFVPKLSGKPLASYAYAVTTFWLLLVSGTFGGMHHGMPVPAWLPALSTVMISLLLVPVLGLVVNLYNTLDGDYSSVRSNLTLKFIVAGTVAFVTGVLLKAVGSVPEISDVLYFTFFTAAVSKLMLIGFASLTLLGCIYYIVPRVTGVEWPLASAVKAHFFLATGGAVVMVVALTVAGVQQGLKLSSGAPFNDVLNAALMGFRLSTLGDLAWMLGSFALMANIKLLCYRMGKAQAVACMATPARSESKEATV